MYYYKFAAIGRLFLIIMASILVVYCAVDIFNYIVLSHCKMCLIVIFSRVKFWHNFWRCGQSGRDCIHRRVLRSGCKIGNSCSQS